MSWKIVGIGEVLWDLLPAGAKLGGAPANFTCHAAALGAEARLITRVGADPLGNKILEHFAELGLPRELVQIDERAATGTVTVELDGKGVPRFTIHENVAWDFLSYTEAAGQAAASADAVCFGSLAQRSPRAREGVQKLVAAAADKAWKIFDINLRQQFYTRETIERSLELANVLKFNQEEMPILARLLGLPASATHLITSLADKFELRAVALTRGEKGSLLFKDDAWSDMFGNPVNAIDTVGAGDAFTAALALGLLNNTPLPELHRFAARLAEYVCTQPGATPPLPAEFRQFFRQVN